MPADAQAVLFCGWDGPPPTRHAVAPEALPNGVAMTVYMGKVTALCGAQIDGHGFKYYPFRGTGDEDQDGMECVSCRMIATGSDPDLVAARARTLAGLREATRGIEAMLELVSPLSEHDEVAELILLVGQIGDLFRDVRPRMEQTTLSWLMLNPNGVRSIRAGSLKYWGEKEKTVKCLDVGEAGRAACLALHGADIANIVYGDTEAVAGMLDVVRDLFREVVSTNGLKEGATRKALAEYAETNLRIDYANDPGNTIMVMGDETPEHALARAIEVARELAVATHFEETWPDKVKGGEPQTKLGVGNLRFVHRVGGGTKKELEEIDRDRLAGIS